MNAKPAATADDHAAFAPCEVCGASKWTERYAGPVRDGAFGNLTGDTVVSHCGGCGVDRLAEASCRGEDFYAGPEYWQSVAGSDTSGFSNSHEMFADPTLYATWSERVSGATVAEIGCGAGGFLDQLTGRPATPKAIVAIEPAQALQPGLAARGYAVFPFAGDAQAYLGRVDIAFCFNVIEHVPDPRALLADTAALLAPKGCVLVSTPNRDDAMMELAPDYPRFFYRAAHRWYFDGKALGKCAAAAGLRVGAVLYVQRYGLANAFTWVREGRPSGFTPLPALHDPALDAAWRRSLELRGLADRLYAVLVKA